jgi:hypothetical protein
MAAEPINREKAFNAGISVASKMVVPISSGTPAGAAQGWVWLDTAGTVTLGFHDGTSAVLIPLTGGLTTEQIQDIVGPFVSDSADLDFTYDDAGNAVAAVIKAGAVDYANIQNVTNNRVLGNMSGIAGPPVELTAANIRTLLGTLDADTLGGSSLATLTTNIVNAISNGAGAAYDTLLEIQAFLQADDTALSGLISGQAIRARFSALAVPSGAATASLVHNLGLANIHDYTLKVFVTATGATEEYAHAGVAGGNSILLTDETGANIAAGRRAFITAGV